MYECIGMWVCMYMSMLTFLYMYMYMYVGGGEKTSLQQRTATPVTRKSCCLDSSRVGG